MDQAKIDSLRQRAARLRAELEALCAEAGDFPAVSRNAARISASLAMISLSLGLDASGAETEGPIAN